VSVPESNEPVRPVALRLWPGVVIVAVQWIARYGIPTAIPEATGVRGMSAIVGTLAVVLWWTFFSRAPRSERWIGAILLMAAPAATLSVLHESLGAGINAMQFVIYAAPVLSLSFVAWAVVSRRLAARPRHVLLVVTLLLACGAWTLVQITGIDGHRVAEFQWRWATSAEDRLVAQTGGELASPRALRDPTTTDAEWPCLRGPGRDGSVPGVRIKTDWSESPPVELWRRPMGPGWSSFAVSGDLLYTQEQRGDDEIVSCYDATTGEPVWVHRDEARFWELRTGAGPRATPTLSGGRVYAFGATGLLNALDAVDGAVVWSRDVAADSGADIPMWGFSSSPLVHGDVVVVAAAGTLAAYDIDTGEPRWSGPTGGGTWGSYSSPHLVTIDGIDQIVLMSGAGVASVAPSGGALLWEYPWQGFGMVQPAIAADGDLLLGAKDTGTSRIAVSQQAGVWTVEERWTSNRLKPYFNDFVVHNGHAFGFDGGILACINLEDGKRRWKGGRYGHGQLLLLADQGVLLVISEQGELALVGATPAAFTELARIPAVTGKTWNHLVLVDGVLFIRNDQEMVAFQLELEGRGLNG
jgi:outer membrane protein assembly factor BamB